MSLCILMFLCIAEKGNEIEDQYELILRFVIMIAFDIDNEQ